MLKIRGLLERRLNIWGVTLFWIIFIILNWGKSLNAVRCLITLLISARSDAFAPLDEKIIRDQLFALTDSLTLLFALAFIRWVIMRVLYYAEIDNGIYEQAYLTMEQKVHTAYDSLDSVTEQVEALDEKCLAIMGHTQAFSKHIECLERSRIEIEKHLIKQIELTEAKKKKKAPSPPAPDLFSKAKAPPKTKRSVPRNKAFSKPLKF